MERKIRTPPHSTPPAPIGITKVAPNHPSPTPQLLFLSLVCLDVVTAAPPHPTTFTLPQQHVVDSHSSHFLPSSSPHSPKTFCLLKLSPSSYPTSFSLSLSQLPLASSPSTSSLVSRREAARGSPAWPASATCQSGREIGATGCLMMQLFSKYNC